MLTVTQFSDTHFSYPGHRSHGGFGYDTDATWQACAAEAFDMARSGVTDLTVITGDLADRGERGEYDVAVSHLSTIPNPANVLAGNHDFHLPLSTIVPRPGLTMDRTQTVGPWLFIFADSNGDGRELGPLGRLVDKADRIESNGRLGEAEVDWIEQVIATSSAEHVWLWMHHPPAMPGTFAKPDFDAEVAALLERQPGIRGIGAGHVHSDMTVQLAGRPIHVCPALTINIDFVNWTTLPPGYRTYSFADNGAVTSQCHLVGEDLWPRFPLPDLVIAQFNGEITWDEMVAGLAGLVDDSGSGPRPR